MNSKLNQYKLNKAMHFLLALIIVASLTMMVGSIALASPGILEVSLPVQVTSNGYYERGQSITYDGKPILK